MTQLGCLIWLWLLGVSITSCTLMAMRRVDRLPLASVSGFAWIVMLTGYRCALTVLDAVQERRRARRGLPARLGLPRPGIAMIWAFFAVALGVAIAIWRRLLDGGR